MWFWHDYYPQSVIFHLGAIEVRWYGVLLVLAMVLGGWYARRQLLKKQLLSHQQFEDLFFYLIIFSLIGARFGHVVFFSWDYYAHYPGDIIKIWQGGLSIQGALLFGLATVLVWSKLKKVNFWSLADCLAPAVALGQAIGRWGNYFNQELFGRPTLGWWGIPIAASNRPWTMSQFTHFQPTFFYESILNLLLFLLLHKLLQGKLKNGTIVALYFGGYAFIRFFMEFIRVDLTPSFLGLRLPQFISLLIVAVTTIFLIVYYSKPLPKINK